MSWTTPFLDADDVTGVQAPHRLCPARGLDHFQGLWCPGEKATVTLLAAINELVPTNARTGLMSWRLEEFANDLRLLVRLQLRRGTA